MKTCDICGRRKVRHTNRTEPARNGPREITIDKKRQTAPCNGAAERHCHRCFIRRPNHLDPCVDLNDLLGEIHIMDDTYVIHSVDGRCRQITDKEWVDAARRGLIWREDIWVIKI